MVVLSNNFFFFLAALGRFAAACGLSLVAASRGYSSVMVCGLLIPVASLVGEHRLQVHGLQ